MRARSKREAEEAAHELLERMRASVPVDPFGIARGLGARVIVAPHGPDTLDGALVWRDDEPIILVNGTHPEAKQRFTAAHCVAHVVLHAKLARRRAVLREERTKATWGGVKEVIADAFATALLMPERAVRDRWGKAITVFDEPDLEDGAKAFGVTTLMLASRLVGLGLLRLI